MPNVFSALFYLWGRSLQNIVISRLSRLRQPKYLLGAIVGVLYLYYFFFRRVFEGPASPPPGLRVEFVPGIQALCAALLVLLFMLVWLLPRQRAALNFTEAEIAFLFPAPLPRRSLVHFRLLSAALRLLFTALVFALLSAHWPFIEGTFAMRLAGWWLLFSVVALHAMGSGFAITWLVDRGVKQYARQVLVATLFVLLGYGVVRWIASTGSLSLPAAGDGAPGLMRFMGNGLDVPPLNWLLWPFKAVLAPLFAADARSFFIALGPGLLVYALHYLWVLHAADSFEEATIAHAGKRAAKLQQLSGGNWRFGNARQKARAAPFDLRKVRVELAFLWKNLLAGPSYLRLRTAVVAAAVIVVAHHWLLRHPVLEILLRAFGMLALMASAYLIVLGPMLLRQDLRSDLLNADILKTYPLRGWQIVLGEILQPMVVMTVALWLSILLAALAAPPLRADVFTPQMRSLAAVGIGLLVPPLMALQVLVMNAAALLFPAWVQTARNNGQRGVEVMGQRIIFVLGQVLVVLLALVPAAIAAALVWFVLQWLVGPVVAAVFAAIAVLGILSIEVGLGIAWLGELFERFDLSAELRP